jgi:hypothetical protein
LADASFVTRKPASASRPKAADDLAHVAVIGAAAAA